MMRYHFASELAISPMRHKLMRLRPSSSKLLLTAAQSSFVGAHYALLEQLVMSAISVLNAHCLMELELSMLICMPAVVVPCAPSCGTRTKRVFLIA